ncbi:hypothetical protein [Robinsoniella peoriensis]
MKVLYKNMEQLLSVMDVNKAEYLMDEEILQFCGPEEDFGIKIELPMAEKIITALYQDDKADVTKYTYCEIDSFYDEEDEDDDFDDDDYDEEDDGDFIDEILDSMEQSKIPGTRRITFPRK